MSRAMFLVALVMLGPAVAQLPVHFEENRGQASADVELVGRGLAHGLALEGAVARVTLSTTDGAAELLFRIVGASETARARGEAPMPGKASYLCGADPEKWIRGVPLYARARVAGVLPGVDAVYYGSGGRLELDLELEPGVDPAGIQLEIGGAQSLSIEEGGAARIELERGGSARLLPPRVYQDVNGERREVASAYALAGDQRLAFALAPYDRSSALVIDPVLAVASHFGSGDTDYTFDVAVDAAGSLYFCGLSSAPGLLLVNPLQGWAGGVQDGYVAKLDPAGTTLLYSTYLGGSAGDYVSGIEVDATGSVTITGSTWSVDFPVVNPLQPALRGGSDVFVARLDPTGTSLVYSTYLGGSGNDAGWRVAVDALGQAHVVGYTISTDFPLVAAAQPALVGLTDAFVTKLSASGAAVLYSTYLGGSGDETCFDVAVDVAGNAFVTGSTWSPDFPTLGAVQGSLQGPGDCYVTKLDPGGAMLFSTYLGGGDGDWGYDIVLDSAGDPWLCGATRSTDFPVVAPLQPGLLGTQDGFVLWLAADGSAIRSSTFLGGSGTDEARGLSIDPWDNILVTGFTTSPDFPVVRPFQGYVGGPGGFDAIATKLAPGATEVLYASFLGGTGDDLTYASVVDGEGRLWLGGHTTGGFPEQSPVQPGFGGGPRDGWIARVDPVLHLRVVTTPAFLVRGEAAVPADVEVQNAGATDVMIDPLSLRFRDAMGADVAGEYLATPSPSNPTVIAAGATETLAFALDVSPAAQLGSVTLDARVTGVDLVTSLQHIDNEADAPGAWDVLGAASVRVVDAVPAIVVRGGAGYAVSVTVENDGADAIDVTTLDLSFWGSVDRTADYVVTPAPGNPTTIPAGQTVAFGFAVDVWLTAALELVTIDATFTGVHPASGTPAADMGADVTDAWDVLGIAYVRVVDAVPATVVRGGAGYAVSVTVENDGTDAIDVTTLDLSFQGSVDRTADYVVTPAPGNPTTIPAGQTVPFGFAVDVSLTAALEFVTIDATFAGVHPASGTPAADMGADVTDAWDVLGTAYVRVVDAVPATVARGGAGYAVSVSVENVGGNAVTVSSLDLSFWGAADRTAEYMVVAAPSNPTSLAAGQTAPFAFTVDVSLTAALETITIDAAFAGLDAVTAAPILDAGADVTDGWDVTGACYVRTVDAAPAVVLTATTGHAVQVAVENAGDAPVTVDSVTLTFTGMADRTGEYTVTADPGNPAAIGGGATVMLDLTVEVSASASLELVTIDAAFEGTDTATMALLTDTGADTTDTWTVVACQAPACGDCNGDGTLSILDALAAAQHAVGVITLSREGFSNCNVTGALEPAPGAVVDVLDALALAQVAAGLPLALSCC